MNKKLTNVLRTNVTLYFICLVLFALAAIPFDVRLAIGEGAAAVVLLIIARRRSRSVQQSMRQYMDRFTGGMDSARSSNMLFAPLPMMVFDADTQAVVWCNDGFLELTEQKEGVFDAHLNAVVPSFSVRWLLEGKNECPENVVWNHRIYRVYGGLTRPTPDTPATMATTYWMDVTDSEQLRQTLQMTRPVVAILMVDNYEDLMKACPESKRSAVLAQLEEKLDQWSAGADGLMLHYDRDRYLFVFEERSYSDYAQHRFAVLDTVREVAAGGVAATLSIGVGRDADSFDALFKNASMALEMALSRGGDQAVIKDCHGVTYYGGKREQTAKNTRVKARVKAEALREFITVKDKIFVMGHKLTDVDAFGAAMGIYRAALALEKRAYIVINEVSASLRPLYELFEQDPAYPDDLFLTSSQAMNMADENSMVVVVDTNRPMMTECEDLLKTTKTIVVLDHHRQSSDNIDNALLSYIEPYASSACEMVSEVLQYIVDGIKIPKIEASSLYAGIMIDTNNFVNSTGVRTFEAAAFLRRSGADITLVRKLFRDDMESYRAKAEIISSAEVYRNKFAIARGVDLHIESPTIIGAQAANELLDISAIKASFVLTEYNGRIYVSARSIDEVNVQIIMERLGGGGHMNASGAQFNHTDMDEAVACLKQVIDEMIEGGDL